MLNEFYDEMLKNELLSNERDFFNPEVKMQEEIEELGEEEKYIIEDEYKYKIGKNIKDNSNELKDLKLGYFLNKKRNGNYGNPLNLNFNPEHIKFIYPPSFEVKVDLDKEFLLLENISFEKETVEAFFNNKSDKKLLKKVNSIKFLNCKFENVEVIKLFFKELNFNENYDISRIKFQNMDISPFFQKDSIFCPWNYSEISFEECYGFKKVNPKLFSAILCKFSRLKVLNINFCHLNSKIIKEIFEDLIKYEMLIGIKEINLSDNPLVKDYADYENLSAFYLFLFKLTTLEKINLQNTGISVNNIQEWEQDITKFHDIQILGGQVSSNKKGKNSSQDSDDKYNKKSYICCSNIFCCSGSFKFSFFGQNDNKKEIEMPDINPFGGKIS